MLRRAASLIGQIERQPLDSSSGAASMAAMNVEFIVLLIAAGVGFVLASQL